MSEFDDVIANTTYAERLHYEKAASGAMRMCQWKIAEQLLQKALALLPADPHGNNIDAQRYRRQAAICAEMARTSPAMRPVADNPEYRAWAKAERTKQEAEWETYRA